MSEGWYRPTGREEWHYFRSWRSLCYRQALADTAKVVFGGDDAWEPYQPNCAECQRVRLSEVGTGVAATPTEDSVATRNVTKG